MPKLPDDSSFWAKAACVSKEINSDIFFSDSQEGIREAKKICERCQVKEECLDFGTIEQSYIYGVWGGLESKEIRRLKRQRRRAKPSKEKYYFCCKFDNFF